MDLELQGRLALVTGASRGIGRAVAHRLAKEGCRLVLVARGDADLKVARDDILKSVPGSRIETRPVNLADAAAIAALCDEFSSADILINNAGAIPHGSLLEIDEQAWIAGWDLKVWGHMRMTRTIYGAMKERKAGVIVNVIGSAGERVMPGYIAGSSGNAALIAFTKAVGAVSPADGIRVVGVNPGPILTERLRLRLEKRAESELADKARWAELMSHYPFGRAGAPEEVADTVAFLASKRAGYITGSIVNVDGGLINQPVTI